MDQAQIQKVAARRSRSARGRASKVEIDDIIETITPHASMLMLVEEIAKDGFVGLGVRDHRIVPVKVYFKQLEQHQVVVEKGGYVVFIITSILNGNFIDLETIADDQETIVALTKVPEGDDAIRRRAISLVADVELRARLELKDSLSRNCYQPSRDDCHIEGISSVEAMLDVLSGLNEPPRVGTAFNGFDLALRLLERLATIDADAFAEYIHSEPAKKSRTVEYFMEDLLRNEEGVAAFWRASLRSRCLIVARLPYETWREQLADGVFARIVAGETDDDIWLATFLFDQLCVGPNDLAGDLIVRLCDSAERAIRRLAAGERNMDVPWECLRNVTNGTSSAWCDEMFKAIESWRNAAND